MMSLPKWQRLRWRRFVPCSRLRSLPACGEAPRITLRRVTFKVWKSNCSKRRHMIDNSLHWTTRRSTARFQISLFGKGQRGIEGFRQLGEIDGLGEVSEISGGHSLGDGTGHCVRTEGDDGNGRRTGICRKQFLRLAPGHDGHVVVHQ